jgi:N-acetylglucosaminyldiphosphoundecaprenol N-acetyl-beta-D-mannosaminyltransferase
MNKDRFRVGNVFISITNPTDAKNRMEIAVKNAVKNKINFFSCGSMMRIIQYAYEHPDYAAILNNSYINIPDGMPLIWAARIWGIKDVKRTLGPELFINMLKQPETGIRHFLLGDTDDILQQIETKYKIEYNSLIAGIYSPPFCNLDEYDYLKYAKMINESNADIVWISMSAPKGDYFALRLLPYLENKIVMAVGASFRFSIGIYNHPNKALQKMGLTTFFIRKFSFRLLKAMFKQACLLFVLLVDIVVSRLSGKEYFE